MNCFSLRPKQMIIMKNKIYYFSKVLYGVFYFAFMHAAHGAVLISIAVRNDL